MMTQTMNYAIHGMTYSVHAIVGGDLADIYSTVEEAIHSDPDLSAQDIAKIVTDAREEWAAERAFQEQQR